MSQCRESVDIIFEDLKYSVSIPRQKDKKEILKKVTGKFNSGELTAILGPSGAGKSSLLNVLTGFMKKGVEGHVMFLDGKNPVKLKGSRSYILQDDNLFPWYTVNETMMLACQLKVANTSQQSRQKMIDNILNTLHLIHTKNTRCKNLSGGQKKRLSIALELIDNPSVLFLDEPTTGLDSSSSAQCVRLLQNLAREGRTIVCTIHQPSATIYNTFDHVYIMAEGQCVYQGSADNTVAYLSSLGLYCPQYHSPADYIIEVANGDYGNFTYTLANAALDNRWRSSQMCIMDRAISIKTNRSSFISDSSNSSSENAPSTTCITSSRYIETPSEWSRLRTLMQRCKLQCFRDWTVTHLKVLCHVLCAILIGLIYGDSGLNATKSINNVGFLIIGVVYLWYTTMMPGVLRFPSEIAILKKETFNGWYKLRTYYLATIAVMAPIHIMFAILYSVIAFLITQQPLETIRLFKFVLIYAITTITADGFGIFLGTVVNPVNGTFFGAVGTCFLLVFSGFLVLFNHMPEVMRILSYFSFKRYSLEGLVLTIYDNNRSSLWCPDSEMYCHYRNPMYLINELGMTPKNFNFDISMMIIQMCAIKTLTYFTLKRRMTN
ncbi:ATP-binding cassette sub-family G member 1 [Phlebotomus papatasi]|uniref:ATP-binding cassette sub-family G member 1 n=1 Tax=Phlebotomus papatasi TaxID=29031 RepID=UPI002483DBCD|nr:ATP-binding cassette sub-family G member 1 [Phlebotomus papatasi]XP_055712990.1 ATP-binding cassette sub-family G member 1 [Phlebotomus papatasi]